MAARSCARGGACPRARTEPSDRAFSSRRRCEFVTTACAWAPSTRPSTISRVARGTGTSLGGGTEQSPERRRRAAAKRKREEKRWAKKSGPVTTRFVDPATLERGKPLPPSPADD